MRKSLVLCDFTEQTSRLSLSSRAAHPDFQEAYRLARVLLTESEQFSGLQLRLMGMIFCDFLDLQAVQRCLELAGKSAVRRELYKHAFRIILEEQFFAIKRHDRHGTTTAVTQANRWLGQMRHAGLQPNAQTLSTLALIYARMGHASAKGHWAELRAMGMPSKQMYLSTMHAWLLGRRIDQVEQLFQDAAANYDPRELERHWLALLEAYCMDGRLSKMDQALASMCAIGISCSTQHIFGIRMQACQVHGDYASARSILEESKASGLQPDVSNFNTLINCYGKAGQLQAAKAILNELRAHGLPPRLTTYNILMHWLGQAGDAEGALALLQTMKAGGVQPDIITKFTLVEALMEGWMRQGQPAALLAQAEALNMELHAASDSILKTSPSRIGGRLQVKVDLHSHGKWRSQLSLLRVLQSLQDGFRQASSTPTADLLIITGQGRAHKAPIVRPTILKFLGTFLKPQLMLPGPLLLSETRGSKQECPGSTLSVWVTGPACCFQQSDAIFQLQRLLLLHQRWRRNRASLKRPFCTLATAPTPLNIAGVDCSIPGPGLSNYM
ncbi:hypothetical protein WJX73_005979 [Symbiochloris irregularis]|uniref:Pentatricopeptide repeat-containing protein n=1 Tax=Symbiochloris irregularis TaxID=706552 RepID=A0AAW1PAE7_9CHLO